MKYKKLTNEEIIIALDRLTRFKKTREKYLRVYSDILSETLISPKFKKTDLMETDFTVLSKMVSEIINNSLASTDNDIYINNIIKEYENSIFVNNEDDQKLLDNNINYLKAAALIPENSPVNLKWLKYIVQNSDSIKSSSDIICLREEYMLKYPVDKVLLVEGITEEILLPAFCRFIGHDFYQKGVHIIAAGGKNQVVKAYYKLADELKIPIYILLDKDAEENITQIKPKLRPLDRIHLVSCGEFEDLLPHPLIIKTINKHFENFLTVKESDIEGGLPMAKKLEELFKTRGLHEFKKSEFAKLVRENISCKDDISAEIEDIVREITA